MSDEERSRVLLISFNQWDFSLAAMTDIALVFNSMGSKVTTGFWSDDTPMRDMGWIVSHKIAHLCLSSTRDEHAAKALVRAGFPKAAIVSPPIRHWHPSEPIEVTRALNRTEIRTLKYQDSDMGRAILQVHPDKNTPITDEFFWPQGWLTRSAKSYAWVYDQVTALIKQRNITSVMVYNGRFLHDRATAAAAMAAGIPVLYYDSGGNESDYDLTRAATHDWADLQQRMLRMYDTWDETERDALGSQWFRDRAAHIDPANALFVEAQKIGSTIERPDAEVVVAYFSSSGDEIAELEFDWSEFFETQGNALSILAEECRNLPGYSLIVRSHPHKRHKPEKDLEEWMADVERAAPDIHVDPHSPVDSYELMKQVDIVVTYGSTTGVEAAFAGKPVIVMGPSAYDLLGCAQRVTSAEELRVALREAKVGSTKGALSWGLMMMRRGFAFKYVKPDPAVGHVLSGEPFIDARPIAQHLSHALDRVRRASLMRH